jgi:hypothetical protein
MHEVELLALIGGHAGLGTCAATKAALVGKMGQFVC